MLAGDDQPVQEVVPPFGVPGGLLRGQPVVDQPTSVPPSTGVSVMVTVDPPGGGRRGPPNPR